MTAVGWQWCRDEFCGCGCGCVAAGCAGPYGTLTNPLSEGLDLLVCEFSIGGHIEAIFVAYGLQQQAVVGTGGIDGGTAIAALQQCCPGIQEQSAFRLFATVAFEAAFDQQRSDVSFEMQLVSRDGWRQGD